MTLSAGAKLGPYEILGPIGAGGMGEVYRARDPRLGREVAIKVLPGSFSADADRLRRFEQEAKAAGILNHPNITAVYDIGSHEGAPYVVQELLEGETLRSALAGGRLSPRKAVDYSLQVAHGLAAAHEKGIVHRDLKPENLFVTRDGRVKILDFGLAKLTHQEEGAPATNVPTATAGTEPGVVLGTLGYMSPEQVRGRQADARSDLFSFGAILYEMLSGRRPFHGDSAADTMSAILKEDPPDLSVTNQAISPGLERIVRHCLEKNPEQRFHSAHDVAFALEALTGTSTPSGVAAPMRARARVRLAPALALAAVAAVGLAAGHFLWTPKGPSIPTFRRLTFRRGNISTARFAPDGQSVIYGAAWEGKPIEVYQTRLDSPESNPLGFPSTDLLSVSRSGELAVSIRERFLLGIGTGTLARAPIGGGAPRPVVEFVEAADWAPDGKDMAVTRFLEGSNRIEYPLGKVLFSSRRYLSPPRFSPRGDRIAFLEGSGAERKLQVVDLAGKVTTLAGPGFVTGRFAVWSPSGDEILTDVRGGQGDDSIEAVSLSGKRRVLLRAPAFLIVHDISRDGRLLAERSSSAFDLLCLAPGADRERELSWFDGSIPVALSADGSLLLFNEIGDAAHKEGSFFVRRTDGSAAVKLGEGSAYDLSADGKWALARKRDPAAPLQLVPTGTGSPVVIDRAGFDAIAGAALLPDGKRVLVRGSLPGDSHGIFVQDIPAGKPRGVAGKGFDWGGGHPISPDGKFFVVFRDWTEDLFLIPTDGGEPKAIPDTKSLDSIRWSADGRSLFASETAKLPVRILKIDVATGRRELWKELVPAQGAAIYTVTGGDLSADAKTYVYGLARAATSDLYLVEGLK
jgi:Tol biopolymer transport system component